MKLSPFFEKARRLSAGRISPRRSEKYRLFIAVFTRFHHWAESNESSLISFFYLCLGLPYDIFFSWLLIKFVVPFLSTTCLPISTSLIWLSQQVLRRTNHVLSLIRHGPRWKRRVQQSSIVVCVFVTAVTFLPSRCLATIEGFLPNRAVT
jgi:hypothetical protein